MQKILTDSLNPNMQNVKFNVNKSDEQDEYMNCRLQSEKVKLISLQWFNQVKSLRDAGEQTTQQNIVTTHFTTDFKMFASHFQSPDDIFINLPLDNNESHQTAKKFRKFIDGYCAVDIQNEQKMKQKENRKIQRDIIQRKQIDQIRDK